MADTPEATKVATVDNNIPLPLSRAVTEDSPVEVMVAMAVKAARLLPSGVRHKQRGEWDVQWP